MSDAAEVDPAWLGQVLRASGHLAGGVVQVQVQATAAFNSHTLKLRVRFVPNTPALTRLVLKRTIDQDWAIAAATREVNFYRLVASLADHPRVVPTCVASDMDDPATGRPWLILADLSRTHAPPLTRNQQLRTGGSVPTQRHIEQVTTTLARLHAYWREHPFVALRSARPRRLVRRRRTFRHWRVIVAPTSQQATCLGPACWDVRSTGLPAGTEARCTGR